MTGFRPRAEASGDVLGCPACAASIAIKASAGLDGGMRVLISASEIAARVDALAIKIARTIPGDFVIVGVLKGAAVFVADLVRALDRAGAQPELEFIRLSSYGRAKESSGKVQMHGDVPDGLAGRPVLLIDDIIDTGRSIAFAADQLRQHGIDDLWTCALLEKPSRREIEAAIDFVGFTIGDLFVAGYGTDYAEKYRHLPYIGAVE
jgi:hypoxanthine phosphoribosyltransferase